MTAVQGYSAEENAEMVRLNDNDVLKRLLQDLLGYDLKRIDAS